MLRIRDVYPGSRIRLFSIPDPGSRGQKGTGSRIPDPQHCFEVLDVLFSLDVLYGGLGITKLQFLIKNISIFFSCKFFLIFVIKTLDPDLDWHSA